MHRSECDFNQHMSSLVKFTFTFIWQLFPRSASCRNEHSDRNVRKTWNLQQKKWFSLIRGLVKHRLSQNKKKNKNKKHPSSTHQCTTINKYYRDVRHACMGLDQYKEHDMCRKTCCLLSGSPSGLDRELVDDVLYGWWMLVQKRWRIALKLDYVILLIDFFKTCQIDILNKERKWKSHQCKVEPSLKSQSESQSLLLSV